MTEKYVQLMEDLQYSKRQLNNWKQKHLLTSQELEAAHQEIQDLRKTVDRLQETNSKLANTNRQLSEQKDSIMTDYSTELSSIKDQIAKKQKEIIELKEIVTPTEISQDLAIRQLKLELSDQFEREIASKDRKIEELSQLNERHSYDRQIERQKHFLKIQSLQNQIKDLQTKHENELQQYSSKLFQLSQVKPPEDKQLLRKAKKENEQLKRRLDLATADLSSVLQQKNQIHKDYSKWMSEHQKQVAGHQQEVLTYKEQMNRLNDLVQKTSSKREEFLLKQREREIKKLKSQAQELRDEIISRDKKISDYEVEKAKLASEIKIIKSDQDKAISKVEELDRYEIQRLQKELFEAKTLLQKMRGQNFQLSDRIHQVNKTAIDSKKRYQEFKKEEEDTRNKLKRQLSEQAFQSPVKVAQEQLRQPITYNQEDTKKLEEALRGERGKLRDFLAKYIELKKKNESLQSKLKKANEKIVQLLRDKIVLGSPKATVKRFQFPTEQQTRISPPKTNQKIHLHNHIKQPLHNLLEDAVINSVNDQKFMTTADFKQNVEDPHSRTNPVFNRQFLSPQENKHIRIEDESMQRQSNERSFYEKSMKMKNQRFRQLKCMNHSNQKSIKE